MITKNDLNFAQEQKYSAFSDVIKSELKAKLSEHPKIQEYTNKINKYHELKNQFSDINNGNEK